ncbi:MAG: dTDP-glucose 4,6-dehydratase [Immundisolibacteraceae bacterium]|nr:dTDP-glucose 4,6-dehydratase [Immundisolibacteraceae bacterium]
MQSWLVTGAAGCIGSNFVRYWCDQYPDNKVVVLDSLTYAGDRNSLADLETNPGFQFVQGDITDHHLVESLLREHQLNGIVNFAAESHVDRSISGPGTFISTNIVGTQRLLEAARQVWLGDGFSGDHRFHQVSTDEVYGSLGDDDPAFTEDHSYQPSSPYAASKASADHLVRSYQHTYGLHTSISNCSNNYGPYQFPEKLIGLTICNLVRGKALPIYGTGKNIRDWLFVDDHCRGIDRVLRSGEPGCTYNIGGGTELTNIELVERLCDLADRLIGDSKELQLRFPDSLAAKGVPSRSLIEFVSDRPGHDWRYAIDISRIERDLGYQPATQIDAGLSLTMRWYFDNEAWWQSVMDGSYQQWIDTQYSTGD